MQTLSLPAESECSAALGGLRMGPPGNVLPHLQAQFVGPVFSQQTAHRPDFLAAANASASSANAVVGPFATGATAQSAGARGAAPTDFKKQTSNGGMTAKRSFPLLTRLLSSPLHTVVHVSSDAYM